MKRKLLKFLICNIKKNMPWKTDEEMEIIAYGLESLYLTITKIIIILLLAVILNIFKETLLMILFYNVIRFFAFGMHAKNSLTCLIMSIILFVGGSYLALYIYIPLEIKFILSLVCVFLIMLYSPADTEKRPLINKRKRKRFKILSYSMSVIMTFLIIAFDKNYISNFMLFGMIEATLMILPITYKLYGLPYNNYKKYSNI